MQLDEASSFVDPETGEVHTLSHEILRYEETGGTPKGLPDWQRDELQVVKRMASVGGFLKRPSKWDVHEWEIMREFAVQVESDSAREELLNAIRGKGGWVEFSFQVCGKPITSPA